jgi:hypothetical protein
MIPSTPAEKHSFRRRVNQHRKLNYGHKIKRQEARDETRTQEKGCRQEEVVARLQLSPLVSNQRRQIFFFRTFMKLCQGQTWKQGQQYLRIVRLERLEVEYKSMASLTTKEGTIQVTSKKDFCRLLKGAYLLSPEKKILPVRNEAGPVTPAK